MILEKNFIPHLKEGIFIFQPLDKTHGFNCKKNPDNIFKNVPSISSRKESCEFCGKLLIIGNIKLHNNTCKQNPKNM